MQLHQTDDHLNIYHLWGSEAPGSGNLHQFWNIWNGPLHVIVCIIATISTTQLSSLSGGREGFFFGRWVVGGGRVCVCEKRLVGKASLAPHCGKEGELFHRCCTWWLVMASLHAKDVACHCNTVLAAHPLCYRHFCSPWALLLQRAQPLGRCWFDS